MSCNRAISSFKPYEQPFYVTWTAIDTDCAPLLAEPFLHTYEYDLLDFLTKSKTFTLSKHSISNSDIYMFSSV